jgi:hypothetical protein
MARGRVQKFPVGPTSYVEANLLFVNIVSLLDSWTEHLVVSLWNDQQMLKEVVDFH